LPTLTSTSWSPIWRSWKANTPHCCFCPANRLDLGCGSGARRRTRQRWTRTRDG
jgi:hypothetical protein